MTIKKRKKKFLFKKGNCVDTDKGICIITNDFELEKGHECYWRFKGKIENIGWVYISRWGRVIFFEKELDPDERHIELTSLS